MALEQDITIRQGDTRKLVVPVLDEDDADSQFLAGLANVDIQFAISSGFGGEELISTTDVEATVEAFGDLKLGADAFDALDTIADTQDVITITIPAAETETLSPTATDLVYQVRLGNTNNVSTERLTPVVGSVTVEGAAL